MSIKQGSIYQVKNHIVACGDSRDKSFASKVIGGRKISLVLTDIPYGVGAVESANGFRSVTKNKVIANDHIQSDEEYRKFTKGWIETVTPYLAKKNSFYIFNSDRMLFALHDGMKDAGVKFAQLLIWIKNNSVMGRSDYLLKHELIVYGWFGVHKFVKSQDKSVIYYPRPQKSPYHPSQKPIGLLRRLILNSSQIGEYVFDGFCGSGSTGLASEQTGRKSILIDLDPEYCEISIKRLEKLSGDTARILYE